MGTDLWPCAMARGSDCQARHPMHRCRRQAGGCVRACTPTRMSVAMTYDKMGNVYYQLGNFEKALEMHKKNLDIKLKIVGPAHVAVATTKKNIGVVYQIKATSQQQQY